MLMAPDHVGDRVLGKIDFQRNILYRRPVVTVAPLLPRFQVLEAAVVVVARWCRRMRACAWRRASAASRSVASTASRA